MPRFAGLGSVVCMYVCTDSAAPAHARTRAHRPAAPRVCGMVLGVRVNPLTRWCGDGGSGEGEGGWGAFI